MPERTKLEIDGRTLEDSVREGFSVLNKNVVMDTFNKSEKSKVLTETFSFFLGAYKTVKNN